MLVATFFYLPAFIAVARGVELRRDWEEKQKAKAKTDRRGGREEDKNKSKRTERRREVLEGLGNQPARVEQDFGLGCRSDAFCSLFAWSKLAHTLHERHSTDLCFRSSARTAHHHD
jgi:hypothetical protein